MSRQIPTRRKGAMKPTAAFMAITLAASLMACGPSKSSGSEYLGKWEGTWKSSGTYSCPLEISRNGESFLVTVEGEHGGTGAICEDFRGVFTLTPEGNLKGVSMETSLFFYDRQKDRVAFSSYGEVQYLKKR